MAASRSGWNKASGPAVLEATDVHVWRISLDQDEETVRELRGLLSDEDQRSAHGLVLSKDRTSFEVSRGFLRRLLGRYCGVAPRDIRFRAGSRGKLFLDHPSFAPDLDFNVSHSARLALIALARGRRVGVDVERLRSGARMDDISRSFFSEAEARAVLASRGPGKVSSFYACWTRKEAAVKALGESIVELSAEVVVSTGKNARLLALPPGHGSPGSWRLLDLPAGAGYAAALCHECPPAEVRLWEPPRLNE